MSRLNLVAVFVFASSLSVWAGDPPKKPEGIGANPQFELKKPTEQYLQTLRAARAAQNDYYFDLAKQRPGGITYENIKDLLAPIRYVNAKWRYAGVILSPKGSTQKFRVIENGFQIDAGLSRRTPNDENGVWATGATHLWITVGDNNELFGADENRQGLPGYESGYLPIFHTEYTSGGTLYEEQVVVGNMEAEYRSPYTDEPGIAAYIKVTAKSGPGVVGFQVAGPPVGYGFPIVSGGYRHNAWTDAHNNVFAYFSQGGRFDEQSGLLRFELSQGQSAYVILPHQLQLAGTKVSVNAAKFDRARRDERTVWTAELNKGAKVIVPEPVVMDAYRSLLIGDWQVSVGDELPYGMFSWYQGNGYAEALQTIAPLIEFGYFADARRYIQPILEYPLSDTGIGLHVVANRLELAAYYYALSHDAEFIRKNRKRLIEVADYFLKHRDPKTGLVMDGYAFDEPDRKVVNINTNTNGWRAIRNIGLTLQAVGDQVAGRKYLEAAGLYGEQVRSAILKSIDRSTEPPFVPFALGEEKPYKSLVESRASSYYNIVMPYFFESEIFPADAAPYTDTLNYMWTHQGVMAGLNRFNGYGKIYAQDGIHPLYTWGRQFSQISRRERDRAAYTFYSSLANGYTRGTFLTGECQGAMPSENEWYRGTYLPPEPPANALLLRSFRHILIHENDRDQDGNYDELWLLSAAPSSWFAAGKNITIDRMPTRFGNVSLKLSRSPNGNSFEGWAKFPSGIEGKLISLYVHPRGVTVEAGVTSTGAKLALTHDAAGTAVILPAHAGEVHFNLSVSKNEKTARRLRERQF